MDPISSPAPGPVVIAAFRDLSDALLARSRVEAAGIEAELLDEHLVGINWAYSQAVGGIRLVVPGEHAALAGAILADLDEERAVPSEGQAWENADGLVEEPACPRCGSRTVENTWNAAPAALAAAALLGVGWVTPRGAVLLPLAVIAPFAILLLAPNRRCTSCGKRWSDSEPAERAAPDLTEAEVESEDDPLDRCPRCGSFETRGPEWKRIERASILFTPLVPLALLARIAGRRLCAVCGERWR